MKPTIFHVSTSINGGAGTAATNLHNRLLDLGLPSYILTLDANIDNLHNVITIERNPFELLIGKTVTYLQQRISTYTFFSFLSYPNRKLLKLLKVQNQSGKVLHIHNWYNFLSLKWLSELEEKGYKIIFTLHDERILTGGCHYSGQCRGYLASCQKCPMANSNLWGLISNNQKSIKSILGKLRNPIFISPSNWLKDNAIQSSSLRKKNIYQINNVFPHQSIVESESRLIDPTNVTIGIASINPYAEIKGGNFVHALEQSKPSNILLKYLRDYKSDKEIFWKEIDILLVPSLQDNSPNVIHEAKLRGVPVIATNVGGIPEIMFNASDWLIEVNSNVEYLLEGLSEYVAKLNSVDNLSEQILSKYISMNSGSVEQFLNLYSSN